MSRRPRITLEMRTVALIGTSYKYQLPQTPASDEFRAFVGQVCAASKIRAIAEEMNFEALSQQHASHSVCEEIANAAGLTHRYCDLSNEQRKELHIRQENDIRIEGFFNNRDQERIERDVRASHEIRERHWLRQLLELDYWPVLFICGANHIEHFHRALELSGLHGVVVARDWAPSR